MSRRQPEERATLPGAEHTLFGGYGPFVALVVLILAMAFLAPTIAPEREVTTRSRPGAAANQRSSATGGVAQERRFVSPAAAAPRGGGGR